MEYTFADFWESYPRKTAKKAALKAWNKIKPNSELCGRIKRALEAQTKIWTDPRYIPYPATWLNGERWDDVVTPLHQTVKPITPIKIGRKFIT